ncbi:hypothetical protein [Leifsonia sp. NPDC058230]|uniref:hypothetical protein n=1 Tax=Leifsonia sp. NPDC058230 TaxID=3346391 RepID=UPI0036DFA36C
MDVRIALLEGGPFDGREWDLSAYSLQAELTDDNGRSATYVETTRISPTGLVIWTVEVE